MQKTFLPEYADFTRRDPTWTCIPDKTPNSYVVMPKITEK
jgi:hypothetical protein